MLERLADGLSITAGLTVFTVQHYMEYRTEKDKPVAYIYDI